MMPMPPQTRTTFPAVITASKWETAYQATWDTVRKARGRKAGTADMVTSADGTIAPKLTNDEAVQLIRAWTAAVTRTRWPLWYQYAAVAYGWDPKRDVLDTSSTRSQRWYDVETSVALWLALQQMASDLDDDNTPAQLHFDPGAFQDPVYVADVREALQQDGAKAQLKIPHGQCRDKKTGKLRYPRWTDKPGECTPEFVDVKVPGASLFRIALIVGAVWWLTKNKRRSRRN